MSNAKKEVTIETLLERIVALETKIENMSSRDRGPKSTRLMTEDDAQKVKFGSLKDLSHREAAQKLGLSYGQIYSCRLGYTFNHVTK